MSNKTIHELDSLSEIAQNDEMLIYDISAGADNPTKKTTVGTIKNYMADNIKDVYSATEVKTNKVWTDGKPIYRLTVQCTLPSNTGNWYEIYDATALKIDTIIDANGICKNGTQQRMFSRDAFMFNYPQDNYIGMLTASWVNLPVFCTFEYTKTTD